MYTLDLSKGDSNAKSDKLLRLRVEYEFVKKDIKNINIRITPDGSISVSAPSQMPEKKVDSFVEEKSRMDF